MTDEIKELKESLNILLKHYKFSELIPEIRTNFVYARKGAKNIEDVAGVPGRISVAYGRPVVCFEPDFGASSHVARFILEVMKFDGKRRSAINIRYSKDILRAVKKVAEKRGLVLSYIDRRKEPDSVKYIEGGSMNWIVKESIENAKGKVPDIIYDDGDLGKEPAIRIVGKNPREILEICIDIINLM